MIAIGETKSTSSLIGADIHERDNSMVLPNTDVSARDSIASGCFGGADEDNASKENLV